MGITDTCSVSCSHLIVYIVCFIQFALHEYDKEGAKLVMHLCNMFKWLNPEKLNILSTLWGEADISENSGCVNEKFVGFGFGKSSSTH